MLTELKAWWWRNVIYKDRLFETDLPYELSLFDVMTAREGKLYIYLGNNKFIQI